MKTERNRKITVFNKLTGDFIERVPINIPLSELKNILTPYDGDPELIMEYEVDQKIASMLSSYVSLNFVFTECDYFLGAYKPLVSGRYVP